MAKWGEGNSSFPASYSAYLARFDVVRMSQPLVPNDREFVANFVQIVFIILIIDSLLWIDARSSAIPGIPLHVLGPEVRLSLNSQLNFLVEVVV